MLIEDTALEGVKVLTPARHGDARGFFSESWNARVMAEEGLDYDFVQDNHSMSAQSGTLRGMHFQAPPHAQAKLVRCVRGRLFDVAVDIRAGSPTFGRWVGTVLSGENKHQLFIPQGFAHGFCVLSETADIIYKCTDLYAEGDDYGIFWADPTIQITWPIEAPILSEKDRHNPILGEIPEDHLPQYEEGQH